MPDHSENTLDLWEPGAPGRGFLLRSADGELRLLLWEFGADGRPTHADVMDSDALAPFKVLASLLIEPDGRTIVIPSRPGVAGDCGAQVIALDERLHEIPDLLDGFDFS